MKRKSLLVLGVLVAGLIVWSQRLDLALNHLRGEGGRFGGELTAFAWSILEDFADRPEVELFVREQLLASARTAVETGTSGDVNQWSLLNLGQQVYQRQTDRLDEEVLTAALVVECRDDCTSGGVAAPAFETLYWNEEIRASLAFRKAMRSAALAIARSGSGFPTTSYMAIAGALADGGERDPALAASVASFTLAADRGASETGWLTDAVDRIAGPAGGATAWAKALTHAPAADLSFSGWNAAIDRLRRSPPLSDGSLAEAVLRHCVRRSTPPAPVDEGCIDLGLAWGGAWAARVQDAVSRGGAGADVAQVLLAAHEREWARTWQNVIGDWRTTAAPPADNAPDPGRGRRTTAMNESAYRPAFARRDMRDVALLLEAGGPAFPAVAAQYRTARHPRVITAAAYVLTTAAPQLLSATVMDRIEQFRPLALSFVKAKTGFDRAAYALEGGRVAAGLLALREHGSASSRIHPLILALSIPEPGFSKYASDTLRETLDADEFADALFGFLAVRDRYLVTEVDIYRSALVSYDGVAPAIEANLTRLLTTARGRPESVPWILKLIGISALGEVGESGARAVLGRYASDRDTYLEILTESDDPEEEPERAVTKRFDDLVRSALDRIEAWERSGSSGPRRAAAPAARSACSELPLYSRADCLADEPLDFP
jgi:hypothetical protein